MPVIAMTVVDKQPHAQTDNLFVYVFDSPQLGRQTVVANLTHIYEVGDVAAVAQLGTLLEEGEIRPRKVFGVESEGMALGPVEEAPDTDLTARFAADVPSRKWTLTFEVEVDAHYPTDAEKAARKMLKAGHGAVVDAR